MSKRSGSESPSQTESREPRQADTWQVASDKRLNHLRRLAKVHDDLEAVESFRRSPFGEGISQEDTVGMYRELLGRYRPFLERINMEEDQRNKALAALALTETDGLSPDALRDHVLRLAKKVERTVAKAMPARQAEMRVIRRESESRKQVEFTEAEARTGGEGGKRPYREAVDAPEWPDGSGRESTWERAARGAVEESQERREGPRKETDASDVGEDPIDAAALPDRRRAGPRRAIGDLAPWAKGNEGESVVENVGVDVGAGHARPVPEIEEPVEDVGTGRDLPTPEIEKEKINLGEPTEPLDVLRQRVREAVAGKYHTYFDRSPEEMKAYGTILEGKAAALHSIPGAEIYGIVSPKEESDEDRVAFSADGLRFAAIDGMGGADNGEVAAEVLARHMIVESEDTLPQRAEQAYRELKGLADGDVISRDGGACFAAMELDVESMSDRVMAAFAHVGDAKAVVVGKDGTVRFMSKDFSRVQERVDAGMITVDEALVHPQRNIITSALAANDCPLPGENRDLGLAQLMTSEQRAGDIFEAIEALKEKGLPEEDYKALVAEVRDRYFKDMGYRKGGMGVSKVELQEGDEVYLYTDGISDNLTMEELQAALKRNGGDMGKVMEEIQARCEKADKEWKLGTYTERMANGVYKDGLKCPPKKDDKGYVEFKVKDLAALREYVRAQRKRQGPTLSGSEGENVGEGHVPPAKEAETDQKAAPLEGELLDAEKKTATGDTEPKPDKDPVIIDVTDFTATGGGGKETKGSAEAKRERRPWADGATEDRAYLFNNMGALYKAVGAPVSGSERKTYKQRLGFYSVMLELCDAPSDLQTAVKQNRQLFEHAVRLGTYTDASDLRLGALGMARKIEGLIMDSLHATESEREARVAAQRQEVPDVEDGGDGGAEEAAREAARQVAEEEARRAAEEAARQAAQTAAGGGGNNGGGDGGGRPPDSGDDDEDEPTPASAASGGGGGGAATATAAAVAAAAAAAAGGGGGGAGTTAGGGGGATGGGAAGGGGGGGGAGRAPGMPVVGRSEAGRVHGSGRDLMRGILSYDFGRTVKRWTHAAGKVVFDWTDAPLKWLQGVAHSASFKWLPFGPDWSKEDRDSVTDLKPEDKKKAA